MSVDLDPPELGFRRPFTHEVTQVLRLRNTNTDPVAFKVKTTAPKQYCVRPNSGRIEGGSEVEVQVLLQAMKEDPPPDARCRDKFLVQSVAIPMEREVENITAIWQNIEKTSKHSIQERKIRVTFLPADGSISTPQHNNTNGIHSQDEAPPAYGSPSPSFGSPAPDPSTARTRSMNSSTGPISSQNEGFDGGREPATNATTSGPVSAVSAVASSVTNAIPTSSEDVQRQLAEARATIAKLRQQAEDQVLRLRKSDAVNQDSRERISTGTTGMGVQQQPSEGVPVQIVAALCLLSFLLAYFFF
ncbi:phosphatidylinositol-binding protein scs2 [Lignoscripta atroalba]|nr:phosphatidylinositol-binding protein scs2 [Lignoscripta atroalba]